MNRRNIYAVPLFSLLFCLQACERPSPLHLEENSAVIAPEYIASEHERNKQVPVFSEIKYEPESQTLTVAFSRGAAYLYHPVPKGVYQQFIGNRFPGSFYNEHIKSRYKSQRLR